jgi:hypothetical protein
MCEQTGTMLLKADTRLGRLTWRWHARGCVDCREILQAEGFMNNYITKAGMWPLPTERISLLPVAHPMGRARRTGNTFLRFWLPAAAVVAIFAVALFAILHKTPNNPNGTTPQLPAAFSPGQDQATTVQLDITAAQALKSIKIVHVIQKSLVNGNSLKSEVWLRRPQEYRYETSQGPILVIQGDKLMCLTTLAKPVVCTITHADPQMLTVEPYVYPGDNNWFARYPEKTWRITERKISKTPAGYVDVEFRATNKQNTTNMVHLRVCYDPRTRRLIDTDNEFWEAVQGRVNFIHTAAVYEYNDLELSDHLFDTTPPPGATVVDLYTSAGIKKYLAEEIQKFETGPAQSQANRLKALKITANRYQKYLAPEDRAEIKSELAGLEVTINNYQDKYGFVWQEQTIGSGVHAYKDNFSMGMTIDADAKDAPGRGIFRAGYVGDKMLAGDFDIQVNFHLLKWPQNSGIRIGLATTYGSIERTSRGPQESLIPADKPGEWRQDPNGGAQEYATNLGARDIIEFWLDNQVQLAAAFEESGKLRLVREGDKITGYYFRMGAWEELGSNTVPTDPVHFALLAWSHDERFGNKAAKVSFENFTINAGRLVAPQTRK